MLRMAEMIRDATQVGENTAVRVGTEIYDIVVELSRMLDMMDDKLENDAVVRIIKSELAKITITDAQIADGAITAAKLADGSVKNRHLASNCVTSDKLQPGAVKHDHLTEDCISTGNIRDGSVTAKKLGTDIYKDIANKVTDIVTKDFPPAIKEKQETEKRFKALEGDISGIRGMVKQLLDKLG